METIQNDVCDNCKKKNSELVVFTKDIIFIPVRVKICQSCISKAFKSFNKNK